jgi:hypothetical protein
MIVLAQSGKQGGYKTTVESLLFQLFYGDKL